MKITSDTCAYVKVTPFTCDVVFRNQPAPFAARLRTAEGWKKYLNQKTALRKIDLETGELYQTEENRIRGLQKARRTIVDYALCNSFEFFGTITVDSKKWDINRPDVIQKALSSKLHMWEVSHDGFKYIYVPEYGEETKRLHFHFLASGLETFVNEHGKLDCHLFRDNFGWCQISPIGKEDSDRLNTALYCSKYITKKNVRISHRYFFNSHGLKKPDRIFLKNSLALKVYDELDRINAHEFASFRYCRCFGLLASAWRNIADKLVVWKKVFACRFRRTIAKYKPHVWLSKPYSMSVNELAIFDDINVQETLL